MKSARIVERPIDVLQLIAAVEEHRYGAISVFLGTVRDTNDGRDVSGIEYTAYIAMAETEMVSILDEAQTRFGVTAIAVEHRIGSLEPGQLSVAIAAADAHREPAMDCTRYVIEEIKRRVPIWKLERYKDGSHEWVDPTRTYPAAV